MKEKKTFIKIGISLILLVFLFWWKVDLAGIVHAFRQSKVFWIVLSLSLHPLGLLISSMRWKLLLKAQDITVSLAKLYMSYLVCGFFNQFLPTRVGGDLMRAYDTRIVGHSGAKSFAVVFVERASGITMLFIFSLTVSLFRIMNGAIEPLYIAGALTGGGGLILIITLSLPVTFRLFRSLLVRLNIGTIGEKLLVFNETIVSYWEKGKQREFLLAFFLAILLQINVIIHYYFLGLAFSFQTSMSIGEYFVIVPLIQVLLMFPLAINGIGLREVSWVSFLIPYGITAGAAMAFSIMDFTMYLLFGAIGGVIYAVRKENV